MKIGILSLPLDENYGGILQAYALQTTLQDLGHEVQVLNISTPGRINLWEKLVGIVRVVFKMLKNKTRYSIRWWKGHECKLVLQQNTDVFINKYIQNRFCKALSEITENEFDAIVVGSDQVWRKIYFAPNWHTTIEDAFLKFAEKWDIIKISYAASFGLDNIDEYSFQEKNNVSSLLRAFDYVSVREASGVDICNSLGKNALYVIDPTLLLPRDIYLSLIKDYSFAETGELFNYILDPSQKKQLVIDDICIRKSWRSFRVNGYLSDGQSHYIQRPVEDWLSGFNTAKAVITDSFHACVFSMIFNKPFLVIPNKDRGIARIESLLDLFGQKERIVGAIEEVENKLCLLDRKPDVTDLISEQKNKSLTFLKKALK